MTAYGENALLTQINAPGTTDGYGDAESAGALLWTGGASCYLRRERRRTKSQDTSTVVNIDALYVRRVTGAPVNLIVAGDQSVAATLLITDYRSTPPVVRRFRVVDIDNRSGGTAVDACRLELDDVRPA